MFCKAAGTKLGKWGGIDGGECPLQPAVDPLDVFVLWLRQELAVLFVWLEMERCIQLVI